MVITQGDICWADSQIITIDRALLTERVGHLSQRHLQLVLTGIDIVLGR